MVCVISQQSAILRFRFDGDFSVLQFHLDAEFLYDRRLVAHSLYPEVWQQFLVLGVAFTQVMDG